MHRGKIIGGIVLIVAIGLIVAQRLHEPPNGQNGPVSGAEAPAGGAALVVDAATRAVLPAPGEVRTYAIDPAASEVYWRIYRSGTFAALGHNHVISMEDFSGSVTITSNLAAAEWRLAFPVAGLVIDDPALRARYGEEFESVPSENDKAGTKTNMLTDRLLNGEVFPDIVLEGHGVTGSLESAGLPVSISIVGQTIEQTFPATITLDAGTITVSGEYRLTHEDLGLTPYTAFGGAIAVGDEIDFTYRIHAVAGSQ